MCADEQSTALAEKPTALPAGRWSHALLKDILEWDVRSWKRALLWWDRHAGEIACRRVLDLGARSGGLSLYFALKGCEVVCSDLDGPAEQARHLHERHGVGQRVTYASVDATAICYPDASFDIVAFKSVLGGIGRNDNYARQEQAVREMHRVLKPGGMLLFAENLVASPIHSWLRRRFVKWGEAWRYLSIEEMHRLLAPFSRLEMETYGFFAAFGRSEGQRSMLHVLDIIATPIIPRKQLYIAFGMALK